MVTALASPDVKVHRGRERAIRGLSPIRVVRPNGIDGRFLAEVGDNARTRGGILSRMFASIFAVFPKLARASAIAALFAGLLVLGGVATSDKADAWSPFWEDWCDTMRVETDKDNPRLDSFGDTAGKDGDLPDSTWAQYGMAGINWDGAFLDCSFGPWLLTGTSDLLFRIPMTITGYVIMFFQWVFKGIIIDQFISTDVQGGKAPLDVILHALGVGQGSFYFTFAGLMIVIGAAVLFWRGILQNSGMSDVLTKVVVMVLVMAFAALFTANASKTIHWFNDTTNGIMGLTFSAFSTATCKIGPGNQDKCSPPAQEDFNSAKVACADTEFDDNGNQKIKSMHAVDCIGQIMYHALVFMPWATGEVGRIVPNSQEVNGDKTAASNLYKERMRLAFAILKWQAYSRSEVDAAGGVNAAGLNGSEFDPYNQKPVKNSKDKSLDNGGTPEYGCPKKHPKAEEFAEMMKLFGDSRLRGDPAIRAGEDPNRYLYNVCNKSRELEQVISWSTPSGLGLPAIELLTYEWIANDYDWFAGKVDKRQYFDVFSGDHGVQRFQTAIVSLVAGLALAVVILLIAMAYLILQIATVIFAMMAPLAALIGLIPVFGTRIFLKWAELFLGTFLKRIGLAVFVGFLMTMYTAVLLLPFQWFMQVTALIAIALVGLVYRKKLFEVAGLGGVDEGVKSAATAGFGASRATVAGTTRFGRNRADGARMRFARARGAWQASKDTERTGWTGNVVGRRVGKTRRFFNVVRSVTRRNRPPGRGQDLDYARRLGSADAARKSYRDRQPRRRKQKRR